MKTDAPGFAALAFLELIDDPELCQEIRSALLRLQLLNETRAMSFAPGGRSSEKPLGPPGFNGLSQSECPSKDRSLYEHYLWQFRNLAEQRAARRELWFLLWEAEHDHKRRVVPPTDSELLERRALEAHRPTQNSKEEEAFAAHIVKTTEGVHSRKVSLDLNLPQGWIEKVRELHGHEPVLGRPRPTWRKLNAARKHELVAEQQQLGHTQAEAARILGCGERTIRDYWPKAVAA